ncbi:MAG: GAF domain-containing sensor histidine kinase [Ardenticatenaceae bacterium]
MNLQINSDPHNPRQIFRLLVFYRWLSLIPPLIFVLISFSAGEGEWRLLFALLGAVGVNGIITLSPSSLNHALRARPWLLGLDLAFMAGLIALTDGWRTPFYLYCLSPLMVAAFFFQWRGAIISTTAFLPMYGGAVWVGMSEHGETPQWLVIVSAVIGFYLISGTFGYASMLFTKLRSASDSLVHAHRSLEVLHDLTVALQSAADIEEVQERVLEAVTSNLGFKRAVIGLVADSEVEDSELVEGEEQVITGWLGRVREGERLSSKDLPHPARLPLALTGGLVARALLEQRICRATDGPCTSDGWINQHFGMQGCLILPMLWGIQPVGVLLVDISNLSFRGNEESLAGVVQAEGGQQLRSLQAIAQQTAVILGMMTTRLRRAKERAIQEERARIAQEMHDTVAQSLFGIVYTLKGCLKLLPSNPAAIEPELEWASQVAEEVRQDIRHTIHDMWPQAISADKFETDLRHYTADTLQATNLSVDFDVRGDFASLSPPARRSMYRICQEALTNIVHHAAANQARICVDVAEGRARLVVRDNGRGFEPAIALAQEHNREHFGLCGMQERARSLKGTCDIFSKPGAGTSIVIDIPVKG